MGTTYQIVVRDPWGVPLWTVNNFSSLAFARALGSVGYLSLEIPDQYQGVGVNSLWSLLTQPDNQIELWRKIDGRAPYLEGETLWFIRTVKRKTNSKGRQTLELVAYDGVDLLNRRIVGYSASSDQAAKSGYLDDLMKDVVRENAGSAAAANRDLRPFLSVAQNFSASVTGSKEFSWRNVLDVLNELAQDASSLSRAAPRYLTFDVVYTGTARLEFRTYINFRGTDRRANIGINPVQLSTQSGGLLSADLEDHYEDEITYVYAGGNGVEETRVVRSAYDSSRISVSPFGRIEMFRQASGQVSTPASVKNEADAALRENRYYTILTGQVQQIPAYQYGVDYFYGDAITVSYENRAKAVRIDGVRGTYKGGREIIELLTRSDALL